MAARWQVRRATQADEEGQHRWDLAYQCLLRWMPGVPEESRRPDGHDQREEETHGGGPVRASLDATPAADPDH
ncbi:MAG: hypothetical protein NVSMB65_14470 [Chloroflexota bacterium]